MIRKAVITIFTALALLSLGLELASFMPLPDTKLLHGWFSGCVVVCRGQLDLRCFSVTSARQSVSTTRVQIGRFAIERVAVPGDPELLRWLGAPPGPQKILMRGLQTPLWIPLILFGAYPTVVLLRGRFGRRWHRISEQLGGSRLGKIAHTHRLILVRALSAATLSAAALATLVLASLFELGPCYAFRAVPGKRGFDLTLSSHGADVDLWRFSKKLPSQAETAHRLAGFGYWNATVPNVRRLSYTRGLAYGTGGASSVQRTTIMVPIWALVVLLGSYPSIALIRGRLRRYRRRKQGLCLNCGYNLTGNVTGRCPECGEAI